MTMAVLDLQRRGQQIGRIRIGELVPAKGGKMRPSRLGAFRFTTGSRHGADAIAALYGGTVRDWGDGQYEVYTDQSAIGVTVPPRDQVVSQWYEMWNRGGAMRRCDSQIDKLSGNPCQCPHADDPTDLAQVEAAAIERARLAAMNPPQACKLVTRINVMIPDLPGLGVFRLDTGSFHAAVEIGDSADLMQVARERGVFLPAILRIEQRTRIARGETKKFAVPVLEVTTTFRQLASGALEAGGITAQLPPPPSEQRLALTSGGTTQPSQQSRPAPPSRPAPDPEPPALSAQEIADQAMKATTRDHVEALAEQARSARVEEDMVCVEDVWEELHDVLRARWRVLSPEGRDVA